MRKNRKHQVHGRLISVPIVGLFMFVVAAIFGYLLIDNRCHERGQLIGDLQKRLAALEDERIRETDKWNSLKTPDELEKRLLQHGLQMVYARPEQVVRMASLDKSASSGGYYQERDRSAGVTYSGR